MKIASAEFHLRDYSPRSFHPDVSRDIPASPRCTFHKDRLMLIRDFSDSERMMVVSSFFSSSKR